ncbi:MAG: tyrosine-type recombinase/integrase, partial [Ignavibacteriaceae bacterium]|nr:tyrosine-type recombinase/integrase [Ignavibacteriaceae bacterium]
WIKHYDKLAGTYKEFSTKIKANKEGFTEARKLLKQFEAKIELNENFTELIPSFRFSQGYEEYIESRKFKERTKEIYGRIKDIVLEIGEDKNISTYNNTDYKRLLNYFTKKKYNNNTQAIYTSHLHAMFEFFKELNYIKENPIKVLPRKIKTPESIDDSDLGVILQHLRAKEKKDQYHLIMFLLITGFRISSALELKWEDIDWNNEFIIASNVKKDRNFFFPLLDDLKKLLNEIGPQKEGKVFNYSKNGLRFFLRLQRTLLGDENGPKITKSYTLHQLRKTFITKLLEHGIPIHTVKALADHSNISTTINYYASINVKKMKEELDTRGIFRDNFRDNKRVGG